jgi:2,3-bisphosphoglycerate-dependent phosphoglycerate mutase
VILVRHAMPELDPAAAHHDWHLGAEGRAAARALAAHLEGGRIVSSDEPKASETADEIAAVCGGSVRLDARLREATRPTGWRDDYRALAARYVGGERLAGWEDHGAVAQRVAEAVEQADIVVTHGLAMTLFLGQSVAFWEQLRFPDAWLTLAGQLRRVH